MQYFTQSKHTVAQLLTYSQKKYLNFPRQLITERKSKSKERKAQTANIISKYKAKDYDDSVMHRKT